MQCVLYSSRDRAARRIYRIHMGVGEPDTVDVLMGEGAAGGGGEVDTEEEFSGRRRTNQHARHDSRGGRDTAS
jgi:hypothetical protein